jgi:hypothetical protein
MKERAFIDIAPEKDAQGELRLIYDSWRQRQGIVPNIVKAVSLRPDLLIANDEFRHALIWGASGLGRRREEMIATLISHLVGCTY